MAKVSVYAKIIAKLEKSSVINVISIVDISNSLANKLFQMFLRYVHSYFQVYSRVPNTRVVLKNSVGVSFFEIY